MFVCKYMLFVIFNTQREEESINENYNLSCIVKNILYNNWDIALSRNTLKYKWCMKIKIVVPSSLIGGVGGVFLASNSKCTCIEWEK